MDDRKKILISLFIIFMIFPIYATAAKGVLSDEAQICLGCHSNKDMVKKLESKETMSLYINGDEFANSIHNPFSCSGCHMDITVGTLGKHLQVKKIKSKKEYAANASKACSMCHPDDQLKQKPIHSPLMAKAACGECHGAHYIKSISEWKKSIAEPQYCLTCHKYNLSKSLSSGELLPLAVNESSFKSSVHGKFSCSACHTSFSKTDHPIKTYKSKKEYTEIATKMCTLCHTDQQLRKNPVHYSLISKATCVECHGSHSIKSAKAEKVAAKENQYCLSCHKSKISMTMKNGESLSVFVDESLLKSSVHGNLQCNACHTGFSKTEHPVRVFKSRRDYTMTTSDLCRKCHTDAYKQYESSIHFSRVKSGDPKAPTCTDCHGGHSIARVKTDKTLGLTSCNKCHGDMNRSYEASIHNKARIKGDKNAPVCSSCHNAHNVQVTAMTTKIKEGCFKCHKDAESVHKKWLSNPPFALSSFAGLHFNTVSCAACHVPDAKRGIYLGLFDRKTGKPFPEEEVIKLLETDSAGLKGKIDINEDGSIDSRELWNLFKLLYKKGVTTTFIAKMDVSSGAEAHQIADKAKAVKECGRCHNPDSEFFKDVFIAVGKADGKPTLYSAKKEVLNSIFSILPASKFYVLGSTNVKLLDILFIIALIGGIAVPIGHITLRIITSPLRSLRRMGKGGKK